MIRIAIALAVVAFVAACAPSDTMSFAPGDHPMAQFDTTPVPPPSS